MGAFIAVLARRWAGLVVRHLANSDYLAGTFAMTLMGVARDAVAASFARLMAWVVGKIWMTVRLKESDAELVMAWLRDQPEVHASPMLTLFSRHGAHGNTRMYEYEPELQACQRIRYRPKGGAGDGGGRARWVWISRRDVIDHESHSERRLRGVSVAFLGTDKSALESILEAGRGILRLKREKHLTVVQVYDYGKEHGLGWLHPQESDRKQPGRSIKSVVLPQCPPDSGFEGMDQAEALLEDAREFLASESWYTERGIPYRRGYLLHGVPGGGKSSLIVAVASELRLPIYMLQLSSELMSDETLNALLQHGMHDPPTILLIEDVDLLHPSALHRGSVGEQRAADQQEELVLKLRRDQEHGERKRKGGRLTLSGLLNALDGPTATTGRLLFMTTNAKHRLDPALIRSGRIDYEVEFRKAAREQIERLFLRFYSDFDRPASAKGAPGAAISHALTRERSATLSAATSSLARQFADLVEASGVDLTTADVQRHLMKHKKDPERSLQEVPQMIQTAKVNAMSLTAETDDGLELLGRTNPSTVTAASTGREETEPEQAAADAGAGAAAGANACAGVGAGATDDGGTERWAGAPSPQGGDTPPPEEILG